MKHAKLFLIPVLQIPIHPQQGRCCSIVLHTYRKQKVLFLRNLQKQRKKSCLLVSFLFCFLFCFQSFVVMTAAGSPAKPNTPQKNTTDGMLPTIENRRSSSLRVIKKSDNETQAKNIFHHQRNASIDSPPVFNDTTLH